MRRLVWYTWRFYVVKSKVVRLCRVWWCLKVLTIMKNLIYDYSRDLFSFQFLFIQMKINKYKFKDFQEINQTQVIKREVMKPEQRKLKENQDSFKSEGRQPWPWRSQRSHWFFELQIDPNKSLTVESLIRKQRIKWRGEAKLFLKNQLI